MHNQKTASISYSTKTYGIVWFVLVVLLALTIAVARLHLLAQFSVVGALAIATCKAALVLYYFMHLSAEGRVVKGMLLLALGALGVIMILTFADVWYR